MLKHVCLVSFSSLRLQGPWNSTTAGSGETYRNLEEATVSVSRLDLYRVKFCLVIVAIIRVSIHCFV